MMENIFITEAFHQMHHKLPPHPKALPTISRSFKSSETNVITIITFYICNTKWTKASGAFGNGVVWGFCVSVCNWNVPDVTAVSVVSDRKHQFKIIFDVKQWNKIL